MRDPWDKAELVAECERLRQWLLLRMDDEARERYRRIADQYFALARQGTRISAHAHSLRRREARVLTIPAVLYRDRAAPGVSIANLSRAASRRCALWRMRVALAKVRPGRGTIALRSTLSKDIDGEMSCDSRSLRVG
jgi:hypothetical protein